MYAIDNYKILYTLLPVYSAEAYIRTSKIYDIFFKDISLE